MGLFGKKKYDKNVSRDNEFLKDYAIRVNALMNFAEGNENVTKELKILKDDFQYSVATDAKEAKKVEKRINTEYGTYSVFCYLVGVQLVWFAECYASVTAFRDLGTHKNVCTGQRQISADHICRILPVMHYGGNDAAGFRVKAFSQSVSVKFNHLLTHI